MVSEEKYHDPNSSSRYGRIRKILILDRDPFSGPAIRAPLKDMGYYLDLVADPREGCRRVLERAYDLVIVSASVGPGALQAILELAARRVTPPGVIVLAGADEFQGQKDHPGVPCLSVLRRPCAVGDVVEAARALVGAPWTDHRKGA